MGKTRSSVVQAYFKALQTWPVFGGYVRIAEPGSERLIVEYSKNSDWEERQDAEHRFECPKRDKDHVDSEDEMDQLLSGRFCDKYFMFAEQHQLDRRGLPPLMLKLSFVDTMIVLGFAFYEVLFDDESTQRFLSEFCRMTNPRYTTGYKSVIVSQAMKQPWLQREESVENRPSVDGAEDVAYGGEGEGEGEGKKKTTGRFPLPIYDWSNKAAEERRPRGELYAKILRFQDDNIRRLITSIRNKVGDMGLEGSIHHQDCVAGLLWSLIMRARYRNGRLSRTDMTQVNISFGGGRPTQWPRAIDVSYFGNSTVTVAAQCPVDGIVFEPGDGRQRPPVISLDSGLARAAHQLRISQTNVSHDYLSKLSSIKRQTPARDDWAAADRALNRASNGLTLEDWTWFEAAGNATRIPYTFQQQPRIFPADNQAEEGKMILLPRLGGGMGSEDWLVYLCLREEDMVLVLDQLEVEGWWEREWE